MIGAPGSWVYEAACYAGYEKAIVDLEFDGVLEFLRFRFQHLVELLSLWDSAGESIKDKSRRKMWMLEEMYLKRRGFFTHFCTLGWYRVRS